MILCQSTDGAVENIPRDSSGSNADDDDEDDGLRLSTQVTGRAASVLSFVRRDLMSSRATRGVETAGRHSSPIRSLSTVEFFSKTTAKRCRYGL